MSPVPQTLLEAGVPTLAVMIGLILDARAFKTLRERIDSLVHDLEPAIRSDSRRQEERLR